jgi:hypothetical protein
VSAHHSTLVERPRRGIRACGVHRGQFPQDPVQLAVARPTLHQDPRVREEPPALTELGQPFVAEAEEAGQRPGRRLDPEPHFVQRVHGARPPERADQYGCGEREHD